MFERLVWGVIGIGVLSLLLSLDALEDASRYGGPSVGLLILFSLVILGLYGLLGYFVARKGNTAAK
jgi:hypothetical protein